MTQKPELLQGLTPEERDRMTYDPARDREITEDTHPQRAGRLVLTLGHECNTPLYALSGLAYAFAHDKPKSWKRRISWSFRFPTGRDTDRLIVKPAYRWHEGNPELEGDTGGWMESGYRLHLNRFHAGPLTLAGRDFPKGVQVLSDGYIDGLYHTVRLGSREQFLREDLEMVAELIETLDREPATVYARSRKNCCFCGRPLTDPVSQAVGYGPDCAEKLGLLHSAAQLKSINLAPKPPAEVACPA